MTDDVKLFSLAATLVQYRFVSVHRIVGLSDLSGASNLPLDVGPQDTVAYLTTDPNPALAMLDHGTAIKELIFKAAFVGQQTAGSQLETVRSRAVEIAQERERRLEAAAVYLVLEIRGTVRTTPTKIARDLGGAILAFDAIDKVAVTERHQQVLTAALASLSVVVDTSAEISTIDEGVSFALPDRRPLYAVSIRANAARVTVSRPATQADTAAIEKTISTLLSDERLATPSQLLVDALRRSGDRLEAFILAWAALEMVIRKFTVNCEDGKWISNVSQSNRAAAEITHKGFTESGHKFYSLGYRARVFALKHNMMDVDALVEEIGQLRKGVREPLFHEGKIFEQNLPVESVIGLVRRLITVIADKSDSGRPPSQ